MKKIASSIFLLMISLAVVAQSKKVPCAANPEVVEDYDPKSPNYHLYTVDDFEIADVSKYPNCTKELVFNILISNASFAAPHAPQTPIVSCQPIHLSGLGDILCVVDEANLTVTNYTMPSHSLRNGKVTRHIMQVGNKIVIRTTGVGNNTTQLLAFFNGAGPIDNGLWHYVDGRLRAAVEDALGFAGQMRFSRLYANINNDRSTLSLLGKYLPGQEVTLFETGSGKTYHCKTAVAHIVNTDCYGSEVPVAMTGLSYQPNWYPTGGSPIQSTIAVFFNTNEFTKVSFSEIKNTALKWPAGQKVAQAGFLKELLTQHPEYRQDNAHNIALNKPELYKLDIEGMDVSVAKYELDFGRESTVAAQFVIINDKAFHFTGAGVLDFSVFKLGSKYFIKSGTRFRTTIDQLFEITANSLVPISTEIYPCEI